MLRATFLYLTTMEELPNEGHALTNICSWLALVTNISIYFTVVAMNENMQEIASTTVYHLFANFPYWGGRNVL